MYRFFYNNYTFWVKKKKKNPKTYKASKAQHNLTLPLTPASSLTTLPLQYHWPSTIPGMCQAYPCLGASALAFPSAWDPLPPNTLYLL